VFPFVYMAVVVVVNHIIGGRGLCKQKHVVKTASKRQGKAIMDVSLL